MPTYVYECKKCEKVFETQQSITSEALRDCQCGGHGTLRRLIQPSAVMFRGAGFHINDYAPASPSKDDSTDSQKPATPAAEPVETSKPPGGVCGPDGCTPA